MHSACFLVGREIFCSSWVLTKKYFVHAECAPKNFGACWVCQKIFGLILSLHNKYFLHAECALNILCAHSACNKNFHRSLCYPWGCLSVLPGPDKHLRPHSPKTTAIFKAVTATISKNFLQHDSSKHNNNKKPKEIMFGKGFCHFFYLCSSFY